MANKKNDSALATLDDFTTAMAVAEDVNRDDMRGKENLDTDDFVLPRLAICQNTSPEKNEDDPKYIDGLKEGDIFNTLTKKNYGRGPLTVAIIVPKKRALEFKKGPDGKNTKEILDFNVPWNDPRCEFTDGPNGTRVKPSATRFYEYYVYHLEAADSAVISMSNSKIKVAKNWNGLISKRPGAIWSGLWTITSVRESDPKSGNNFFNFKVQPAGPTPKAITDAAEGLYAAFSKADVKVHDVSSDDANDSGQTGGGQAPNIPF